MDLWRLGFAIIKCVSVHLRSLSPSHLLFLISVVSTLHQDRSCPHHTQPLSIPPVLKSFSSWQDGNPQSNEGQEVPRMEAIIHACASDSSPDRSVRWMVCKYSRANTEWDSKPETRMLYHSVPGLHVCLTVREACVNDTAVPCFSTPMHMNARTHLRLLTLIIKQSSCGTKQQSNSLTGAFFSMEENSTLISKCYHVTTALDNRLIYELISWGTSSVTELSVVSASKTFRSPCGVISDHLTLPSLHFNQT